MKVRFHRHFDDRYKRLRETEKRKFKERKNVFLRNPFEPILNNHPLHGRYKGYRSINITGDLRAVYRMIDKETAYFVTIDTHSNLYS